MAKKVYDWQCELFGDKNNPKNWFIDGYSCSDCYYPLSSLPNYGGHPNKYCPGCGEIIEGVKNPKPPIGEK